MKKFIYLLFFLILLLFSNKDIDNKSLYSEIDEKKVYKFKNTNTYIFESGLHICADGSPNAYHPEDKGLDYLKNAGHEGNWWSIVTDNGKKDGNPVIQNENDISPGYYISTTALFDKNKSLKNPGRYVNSEKVSYIVLPPEIINNSNISLGDLVVVFNKKNNNIAYSILADIGPDNKIGEGSIALADELKINSCPKSGGVENDIVYLIFAESGFSKPLNQKDINLITKSLFKFWGNINKLKDVIK